jgi:predicted permease
VLPAAGRVILADDDRTGAASVVVLSNGYSERRFGDAASAIGQHILINNVPFTVVGVTPAEFFGVRVRRPPDMWLPLAFHPQIELRESYLEDPQVYFLTLMGRLKDGVKMEQAQAISTLALQQFLTEQAGSQLTDDRRRAIQNTSVGLFIGSGGISGLRTNYSRSLQMLMAIVGMVLLIVCANIGSLLLSRSTARKAEISLRMALGATRSRIIRQLFTESMLLAFIGGMLGVFLSYWGVTLLVSLVTQDAPLNTRPDLFVLSFTVAVSLLAGVLFGLVPAVQSSKSDLVSSLKEKAKTGSGRLRFNLSSGLVVAQVALSMVLLTGAGLFAAILAANAPPTSPRGLPRSSG